MVLMMVVSTMVILPLTASAVEPYEAEAVAPTQVDGVYQISEPGNLVWLGKRDPMGSGTYVLTQDIDMAGVTNFKSAKANSSAVIVFDGQDHAIKNLTVVDGMGGFWCSGLFGLIGASTTVTIKDLKMETLVVDTNTADYGNKLVGGLVGENEGTLTIENCSIDAASTINLQNTATDNYVGGFVGYTGSAGALTIKDSTCAAYVHGYEHTEYSNAGGFVGIYGSSGALTFENCVKSGDTYARQSGGFVGVVSSAATSITFTDCEVNGVVKVNGGGKKVGGFIGTVTGSDSNKCNITATNCVNNGDNIWGAGSSSGNYAGGFFGHLSKVGDITLTNCVNNALIKFNTDYTKSEGAGFIAYVELVNSITFNNCINNGKVTSTGGVAAGFIGRAYNNQSAVSPVTFNYCINKGDIQSRSTTAGFVGLSYAAMLKYIFNYCGNEGAITATAVVANGEGDNAVAGFIGYQGNHGDRTSALGVTATNCYNIGKMSMASTPGSYGGFAGFLGRVRYTYNKAHPVIFDNCFVNCEVGGSNALSDFYGSFYAASYVALDIKDNCKVGAEAAEGIAKIRATLNGTPDTSKEGGKFSLRMKLTDDFGFMAILEVGALTEAMSDECGFLYATAPFTTAEEATKVAPEAYLGDATTWCFTYTDLTAATLDQTVYVAAYTVVDGETFVSDVREINVLTIVTDLADDGCLGSYVVTTNAKEITLYAEMVAYHVAYKEYLDSVTKAN